MGKILFASDMDGTLLNSKGHVSEHDAAVINRLAEKGLLFTVATARSPRSAMGPVRESGFTVTAPAVCLNGALLWDMASDRPVQSFPFSDQAQKRVWQLIEAFPLAPRLFMEPDANGLFTTLYVQNKLLDPAAYAYMEAQASPQNPFFGITAAPSQRAVAVSYFDEPARLRPLYEQARTLPGVKAVLYDSTAFDNRAYMEIFSDASGKGTGVLAAKAHIGAEKVFAFGDNFNDIDMFAVADQSFATANGEEEIRQMATHVIPSNDEGGVISTMAALFAQWEEGELA